MRAAFCAVATVATLLSTSSAFATPLTAQELLNAYNLISLGNVTSKSEVDGKAYIGGTVKGGGYNQQVVNQGGSDIPSLTVVGDVTGTVTTKGKGLAVGGSLKAGSNFTSNDGGSAYVKGSWAGTASFNMNGTGNVYLGGTKTGGGNLNGGNLFPGQNSASFLSHIPTTATTDVIKNTLSDYSAGLKNFAAAGSINISGSKATFNAAPNSAGLAVFEIDNAQAFFSAVSKVEFNMNGATELIVNVLGAGANLLNVGVDFLGGTATARAKDTLWNFVDAEKIKINLQFGGDILALLADVTLNNNLEGTLVAKSLTQNNEIHYAGANPNLPEIPTPAPPPGEVPLPASMPLFLSGAAALGWAIRRRRTRTGA